MKVIHDKDAEYVGLLLSKDEVKALALLVGRLKIYGMAEQIQIEEDLYPTINLNREKVDTIAASYWDTLMDFHPYNGDAYVYKDEDSTSK